MTPQTKMTHRLAGFLWHSEHIQFTSCLQ